MSYWAAVAAIEAATISSNAYRTARRLLDLAAESGQCKISKPGLMEFCGIQADGTMRRQLGELQRAGIIHFSTNEAIHVSFVAYPTVDGIVVGAAPVITTRAPVITTRASTITTRAAECAEGAEDGPPEPDETDPLITTRASTITTRASTITTRAAPHTRDVCLFVCSPDPEPSEEENKQTNNHARTERRKTPPEPLTDEQAAAFDLLCDEDVGLAPDVARRFAVEYEFDYLVRQVFEWRRQLTDGTARGAGALVKRIQAGFGAIIIDTDRASPLWKRHMQEYDQAWEEAELRRRYLPDELADIIIG